MIQWRLKKGHDRRLREGHPWIFSNELAMSPKGVPLGGAVAIYDWDGKFMAYGYGNPHSLISARVLSTSPKDEHCVSPEFLRGRVLAAWRRRHKLGMTYSYRLVFGEGDLIPGMILDRYVVRQGERRAQIFAIQMTTAGIDQILQEPEEFFRALVKESAELGLHDFGWEKTAVVIRNDTGSRELEGLAKEEPRVLKAVENLDLSRVDLAVPSVGGEPLWLACDLLHGQKTGFFLDQVQNILRVGEALARMREYPKTVRILDICCYVGHWSSQLTAFLRAKGVEVSVDLLDVSAGALERAELNARRAGAHRVTAHKIDVFEKEFPVEPRAFDIVIADPPALIKSRKAIPQGEAGYVKINLKSLATVKAGGLFVTCSCSGLFSDEDFTGAVHKAFRKAARRGVLLFKGLHNTDHPQRPEFPEGTYLKMHVYQLEESLRGP